MTNWNDRHLQYGEQKTVIKTFFISFNKQIYIAKKVKKSKLQQKNTLGRVELDEKQKRPFTKIVPLILRQWELCLLLNKKERKIKIIEDLSTIYYKTLQSRLMGKKYSPIIHTILFLPSH